MFVCVSAYLFVCSNFRYQTVCGTLCESACLIVRAMDSAEAWDLEMELLCLPASGGSVRKLALLSRRIAAACNDVPQHVRELGAIKDDSHRERNLHRWVCRQPWGEGCCLRHMIVDCLLHMMATTVKSRAIMVVPASRDVC